MMVLSTETIYRKQRIMETNHSSLECADVIDNGHNDDKTSNS